MRLTTMFLSLLLSAVLSASASAQQLTVKEVSPLRVVDKTGASVGEYIWSMAIPEIGVGNVIFSSSPVPYGKEATYDGVGKSFDITKIPALYYRQYQPARNKDMIDFILAKNPGYKFVKKFELIEHKGPKAIKPFQVTVMVMLSDEASMAMSTTWNQFFPTNDYRHIDVRQRVNAEKGTHTLRVGHYLQFDTGKTKLVTEAKDGRLITQSVPILRDVAVAYGECTLVNP